MRSHLFVSLSPVLLSLCLRVSVANRNPLPNPRRCSYPDGRAYTLTSGSNAVRIYTACSLYRKQA
jgi:hypothetical protein